MKIKITPLLLLVDIDKSLAAAVGPVVLAEADPVVADSEPLAIAALLSGSAVAFALLAVVAEPKTTSDSSL